MRKKSFRAPISLFSFSHRRSQDVLSTHSNPSERLGAIVALVTSAFACEQCCTLCADACLGEDGDMDLTACIRTNLDCADICATTGRVLTRMTQPNAEIQRRQLEACVSACDAECSTHAAHHEHCHVCAECCRECSQACQALLAAMPQGAAA